MSTSAQRIRPLRWAEPPSPALFFCGIAGLLDEISRHGNRIANAADVAVAGAEPLVVVGVVVDLEGHDAIADHVGMIHPRRSFLLIGGVGVAFQSGVGVSRHVPGVGDARGGLGVEPRRAFGADRLDAVPEVNPVVVSTGVHRLLLEHGLDQRVDRLTAADPVLIAVLPGHHGQPGAGVEVVGELLDDGLEAQQQVLPPLLVGAGLLEEGIEGVEVELLPSRGRSRRACGLP